MHATPDESSPGGVHLRTDRRAQIPRWVLICGAALFATWFVRLFGHVLAWPTPLLVVVLAAVGLTALALAWRGGLYRHAAPTLFVAFWVVWALTLPWTTAWAPGSVEVRRELRTLIAAGVLSCAALLAAGGRHSGRAAFSGAWMVLAASLVPLTLSEIVFDRHLPQSARGWVFPPHQPAATFVNPNNYACVLVVLVGVLLISLLRARQARAKAVLQIVLGVSAMAAVAIILSSGSRAALLAALVQCVAAALVALGPSTEARSRISRLGRRHRLAVLAGVLAVVGVLGMAMMLSPRNPLQRLINPDATSTRESDALRVQLTEAGLRYFRDHPLLGTGVGSFESLLASDPSAAAVTKTNMHNGFVELLSQYGLIVTLPLIALALVLAAFVVRPRAHGVGVERLEVTFLLGGLLVMGLTVSSAVTFPLWWFAMAHAAAVVWSVRAAHASAAPHAAPQASESSRPLPI